MADNPASLNQRLAGLQRKIDAAKAELAARADFENDEVGDVLATINQDFEAVTHADLGPRPRRLRPHRGPPRRTAAAARRAAALARRRRGLRRGRVGETLHRRLRDRVERAALRRVGDDRRAHAGIREAADVIGGRGGCAIRALHGEVARDLVRPCAMIVTVPALSMDTNTFGLSIPAGGATPSAASAEPM